MSKRILNRVALAALLALCTAFSAQGQAAGVYTPYSIYGVGDLSQPGTAYNKSMGGVGVALRNNTVINVLNPASVTARDSLAFMTDFSLYNDNKVFNQGGIKSASNTFNINDLAMSFPLWKNMAMMVGIMPFSDTGFGYGFEYTDPDLIGRTGNITYSANGNGSIYKAFAAVGVTFAKRLSLGAQWNYHFGSIDKTYYTTFNDASYNSIENGSSAKINAHSFKFGLQFEQPLSSRLTLGIGATYSTPAKLRGTMESSRFSSGTAASDTLFYKLDYLGSDSVVTIPSELAVGISFKNPGKWLAEFDYSRANWSGSGLDSARGFSANKVFSASVAEAFRFGFEIIPNRNDVRSYFMTAAYRLGAYHKNEYYLLDGKKVASTGITLGVTLPVYLDRLGRNNGITLGVDVGQRGALTGEMIRERYINFSIGFNFFDIWFRKTQYM
ncbi:MAG: hypothetical protein K5849_07995 [Bacteroidales bacterium]|nr:hypothetical protein [Bacteroidales bacterium]